MNKQILQQKQDAVAVIKDKLKKASSVVLMDYRGLTVAQDTALRSEFRKSNIEYKVLKNKIMLRAFNELGYKELDSALNGPTAIAISYDDVVAPAKIAAESITKLNKMEIKGGLTEGKFTDVDAIKALAKIPSKEVLIGQLLGMLTMPLRSFAVVLDQAAKKM